MTAEDKGRRGRWWTPPSALDRKGHGLADSSYVPLAKRRSSLEATSLGVQGNCFMLDSPSLNFIEVE